MNRCYSHKQSVPPPLQVDIQTPGKSAEVARQDYLLAEISFSDQTGIPDASGQQIEIALPPLMHSPVTERWYSDEPVTAGQMGNLYYRKNRHMLFGHLYTEYSDRAIRSRTYQVYHELLASLKPLGYPHLLRMWNYFPEINHSTGALDQYNLFCMGRHEAFHQTSDFARHLPAASAIGSRRGGLLVYFIAGKTPAIPIENPRQTSAYRYPELYGPRPPSFSRAMLTQTRHCQQLFLSGTASIVGHETLHRGNPESQLGETLENIHALLEYTDRQYGYDFLHQGRPDYFRVYIRRPEDVTVIRDRLERQMVYEVPISYLQGDICRSDLLLEIEAMYSTLTS